MSGLGLIIDDTHEATINSFRSVPVSFCAAPSDLPERWFPPLVVENQGGTSSCAGHAEALACSHSNFVTTREIKRFSRRFAYITSQTIGNFLGRDAGTSIASTIAAATKYGCCLEETCPFFDGYDIGISKQSFDEAVQHKHHGDLAYDCRDWDTMIAWLTDRRPIIIGTRWYSGQDACSGVEDKRCSSGSFRGYHARCLIGWDTLNGELVPVVQNSHGQQWADHGRSIITRDQWDFWGKDANFCAFGFTLIDEVAPARRDWSSVKSGDVC